jgi:DHA1 family bicyclomycin/chloramphenicol resistance-like MFS transporter
MSTRGNHLNSTTNNREVSFPEFVIIVSLMMSLTALSIDTMLPALSQIGADLNVARPNDRQLVISVLFLGQALGQLFFGPLSDKTGRKPAIAAGYALFIAGSAASALSISFPMMLAGRALQGIGISAPRAVSMALVRDRYEGRTMARLMSFAMAVFILVPTIAPSIGQGILTAAGWRSIFIVFVVFALFTIIWFLFRMPETLDPKNRVPFSIRQILNSIREILTIRPAIGYTLVAGLVYGAFLGYLNSSQQILQEHYALGDLFPIYFAIISLSLGSASVLNARLVMRFGMTNLVRWALWIVTGLSLLFTGVTVVLDCRPALWLFMTFLMLTFFFVGILFGNINSMAMQPLGHLAGTGAAVVGSLSTLMSMLLGMLIGRSYNGTVLPLVVGIAILSFIGIFVVRWAAKE